MVLIVDNKGLKILKMKSLFSLVRNRKLKEVKPVHVPENSMTLDGAHMLTSTPKQGIKPQQLKVKFQDEEVASNEGFHAETPANNYLTMIYGFVTEVET